MTYRFPRLQEFIDFLAKKDIGQTPAVLNNHFPTQQQQHLIANQPQAPQGGNGGSHHPLDGEGPSIVYTFEMVDLQTRAKNYGALVANVEEASLSQNPSSPNDIHIERSVADLMICPQKGALRRKTHNTSTCVA